MRREKLEALRKEMAQRLAAPRRGRIAMPEPRYDEVFEQGAAWLESLTGARVPVGVFEGVIGDDIEKAASRAGDAD